MAEMKDELLLPRTSEACAARPVSVLPLSALLNSVAPLALAQAMVVGDERIGLAANRELLVPMTEPALVTEVDVPGERDLSFQLSALAQVLLLTSSSMKSDSYLYQLSKPLLL